MQDEGVTREEDRMSVGKICVRTVVTARPEETIHTAAKRMAHYSVGTLVVVEERRPVGILTDRDLVVRVLAQEKSPTRLTVGTVMSGNLVCVQEETPLEDALRLMRGHRIRRLVVVSPTQELVGLFALDDMLELLGEEQQVIADLMRTTQAP
jgi:CBS domain-containing protein